LLDYVLMATSATQASNFDHRCQGRPPADCSYRAHAPSIYRLICSSSFPHRHRVLSHDEPNLFQTVQR
ncbi:hypothetical protein D027_1278B, partial [Vibrio parahaemolyticus 861]